MAFKIFSFYPLFGVIVLYPFDKKKKHFPFLHIKRILFMIKFYLKNCKIKRKNTKAALPYGLNRLDFAQAFFHHPDLVSADQRAFPAHFSGIVLRT